MAKRIRWTEMDKTKTPFSRLRESFRLYNQTTGKSPHTVKWYEFRLDLFERWVGDGATLAEVTIDNVRGYIAELQNRTRRWENNPFVLNKEGGLSTSYIQGFARTLRAFATWLHADGYTDTNVLKSLKPPRIQQRVHETLTDDEVSKLVAVLDQDDVLGARDFALIWTMLDCGLRASEVCNLTLENAHIDQGYLKILGKGNKERLVPIGRACQEALTRWRERFRAQFDSHEATLFLSATGGRLTVDALEAVVTRTARRAGIRHVHCHLLRHTFATNYLVKEVGDSLRLQQILGHTSLEMVRRYVALANVQQSLIERRASPMDLIVKSSALSNQRRRAQPRRPRRALRVVK